MAAQSKGSTAEVAGAAAVAGTAGLLVAGPALAVVGAVGAGYVAATHGGDVGEVARATGRAASTAYTKAAEYDREHKVGDGRITVMTIMMMIAAGGR